MGVQGWAEEGSLVRAARPVSSLPLAPTQSWPLGTTYCQFGLTVVRSQTLGRETWEKLSTGSSPSMEKGLGCVGMVGTAGLPTAAGSGLVKSGKSASCDLPPPFLLGGRVRPHNFPPPC